MKKKIALLFLLPALLSGCAIKPVYVGNGEQVTGNDVFTKYYNLKKLTSSEKLIYVDVNNVRPYVFNSKQEANDYASILKEKSVPYTVDNKERTPYGDMISFLEGLDEDAFKNRKLVISSQFDDATYNKDSCRFVRMYLKNQNFYLYLVRDYMNKTSIMVHQTYTFFINKDVNVNAAYVEIDNSQIKY